MRKIRVMHVINSYSFGGAEKLVYDIVKKLDKNKFEVFVCAVGKGAIEFEDTIIKDLNCYNVKALNLNKPKNKKRFTAILNLRKIIRENKIEVINTHCTSPDFLGRAAARLCGLKNVFSTVHNTTGYSQKREKVFKHFTKKYIAISKEVSNYVKDGLSIPGNKLVVINNGIVLEKYIHKNNIKTETLAALGLPQNRIIISNVSRIVEQKGHVLIIKAAKEIIKKYPQVLFVFAGDETHEPELVHMLKTKVREDRLEDNILFMGVRNDIPQILSVSDIFLFPSNFEGFSLSILEAMASGLPVIATDVGSIREVCQHGKNGLIIPKGDENEISKAVLYLLDNMKEAQRMGKLAQENIMARYSLDNTVKGYQDLYIAEV